MPRLEAKFKRTPRGFLIYDDFIDKYGKSIRVQKSSIATEVRKDGKVINNKGKVVNQDRLETADLMYKLRKMAERAISADIKDGCIALAEKIEASYLTALGPEIDVFKGEEFENYTLFTVNEFAEAVKLGHYNDYDGTCYYGNTEEVSRLLALPSDFAKGKISNRFTHVIWYNK